MRGVARMYVWGVGQAWRLLRHRRVTTVAVVLSLSLAPVTASARLFREIFLFGDSLSDTGNVFDATDAVRDPAIPVSPPYFMGRFANGPVWAEILAETLGLDLEASLTGGTNFAFGGAEIGSDTEDLFERDIGALIPSLRSQVQAFLTADFFGVEEVDPAALYIVWGGANDLRDVLTTTGDPLAEAQIAADELVAALRDLADAGAVYFLVPNLPNLGLTPESRALGSETVTRARAVSAAFNNALAAALQTFEAEHPVAVTRLNTFALLEEMVTNPATFGFTNVTDPCLDGDPFTGGVPCASPETYLFWDSIHPTAAAHTILAEVALATLPPLVATRGNDSPRSAEVSLPEQDLPVLQIRLGTGAETLSLTRVTVAFTEPMSAAGQVQTLRAHLIHDVNENGQFDAGEAVLASAEAPGVVATLTLEITPAFDLAPVSTTHLLVTLDLNQTTGAVAMREAPRSSAGRVWLARLGWLAVLLPGLGLVCQPGRRQRILPLGLVLLYCGLLASCDLIDSNGDDNGANGSAFTVVLPQQGISGQGVMSGPFTVPPVPVTGATVMLEP